MILLQRHRATKTFVCDSWTVSMYRVEMKRFSWRHNAEPGPGAGAESNQEDHAPERTSLERTRRPQENHPLRDQDLRRSARRPQSSCRQPARPQQWGATTAVALGRSAGSDHVHGLGRRLPAAARPARSAHGGASCVAATCCPARGSTWLSALAGPNDRIHQHSPPSSPSPLHASPQEARGSLHRSLDFYLSWMSWRGIHYRCGNVGLEARHSTLKACATSPGRLESLVWDSLLV